MSSEQEIEIYRQHRAAQGKYVYFLLAVAGAAIALAVNQTQGLKLACTQIPLAFAVGFWGFSFFFGCRHLVLVETTLFANAALFGIKSGNDPKVGTDSQSIAAASAGITKALDSNSIRASWHARWQFCCLILGAVSYLGWHIFEMWLRSTASQS